MDSNFEGRDWGSQWTEVCIVSKFYCQAIKLRANGHNNSQHCWPNNVGSCCIGFHVAKILTDFKLCTTTSNRVCMQLTDATCNIQQCCICLHVA